MVLAQSANAPVAFNEMLPWLGLLVLITLVGVGVVYLIRRELFRGDDSESHSMGVMSDLRSMRDRGEITEDEFERTRAVMIARATGKDPETVRADAIRKQGGVIAEPGFDLTGRPLPSGDGAPGGATDSPGVGPDSGEDV